MPNGPDDAAIDVEVLDGLRDLGEGEEGDLLGALIEEFLDLTRATCHDIADAIGAHDPQALVRAAHKLKGGAASMGANPLAEIGRCLEEIGRGGTTDGAWPIAARLDDECVRVTAALAAYRA